MGTPPRLCATGNAREARAMSLEDAQGARPGPTVFEVSGQGRYGRILDTAADESAEVACDKEIDRRMRDLHSRTVQAVPLEEPRRRRSSAIE